MFQRYYDAGLAQASYLIACGRTRQAVVVDPRRDIDIYAAAAGQHQLQIVAAIETHVHADFVSGARELGEIGARVIAGPGAALKYSAYEVHDDERLPFGDLSLRFLHTPGHTPEHISIVAQLPGEPDRGFTGDTLFVGAVGRPDLLGAPATRGLAEQLHASLFDVLLALPDAVEVHPGHGAGSLCGTGIGADPHSTIGRERFSNPMLRHHARGEFVAAVLGELPETPPYFRRMKRVNQDGPPVLGLAEPFDGVPPIDAQAAHRAAAAGAVLIDLRPANAFCAEHAAGAMNIAYGPSVGYWAGWVVPPAVPIVLMGGSRDEALAAGRQLLRVGLDSISGFVDGGLDAWRGAGLATVSIPQIAACELHERLARGDRVTIVDVRTAHEWQRGHIDGSVHLPVGEIPSRSSELPRGGVLATICEGGYRSSLAASLLAKAGLAPVVNVTGGMAAYRACAEP
jgi:hydroxyacylglutathione hydrolase